MKPLFRSLLFAGLSTVFCTSLLSAQTKAEKKVKTEGMTTDMYNSSKSKEAMDYFGKGEECTKKEDYKGAIKWYKKALKEDDKFVEAYDNLGVAYRKSGDLDHAKECYLKSIELYPQGPMAHMNLGVVYGIEKNYDKAIEQYKALQKIDSTDPEGYYGTIQIYLNQSKFDDAIKSATKTMEIYQATKSPYLGEAQYLLGLSYYYNKDKKNAAVFLKQAKASGVRISKELANELGI
jgi:tetratricopeptide (TPR) repeat protein